MRTEIIRAAVVGFCILVAVGISLDTINPVQAEIGMAVATLWLIAEVLLILKGDN